MPVFGDIALVNAGQPVSGTTGTNPVYRDFAAERAALNGRIQGNLLRQQLDAAMRQTASTNDTRLREAQIGADTARYGADANTRQAQIGADASTRNAQVGADATRYRADADYRTAQLGADTTRYTTDANNRTAIEQSRITDALQRYMADIDAGTRRDVATIGADAQRYGYDKDYAARLGTAQINADTTRYTSDQDNATARRGQDTQFSIAGMQDATTRRGQDLGMQRFDRTSGLFERFLFPQGAGGAAGPNGPEKPQGLDPAAVSESAIQDQINAANATAQMTAGSRKAETDRDLAARGFGSNSPLAMALKAQIQAAADATAADQGRQVRWQAAPLNADQAYRAAQLRQQQYATDSSFMSSIAQALANFVQS